MDAQERQAYDVVVIGGGAAGLSAALVLGRARRRVAVVDAGAPRNAPAAHMQGFLSRDGMAPTDLLAAGRAEVTAYGVELLEDEVLGIEPGFIVRLARGQVLTARRILVATGVGDELPDIPGVRERWGRDLLHCPYCHGWEVRDEPLGVLGAHPGSLQHAQLVRQWSEDVVFFAHTYELTSADQAQLEARSIRIVRGQVARLVVEADRLTGVELTDGRVIPRTAVFIRPGNVPHADGLLSGLGCELDEAGFVTVDATGRTSSQSLTRDELEPYLMWNDRYADPFVSYGTEPNHFLREVAERIPDGPVLCLAEGEGRNAVFLAEMGHAVTAVDLSDVGLANAARLAAERGVEIATVVADLAEFELGEACWAGVVSIWGHLPRVVRTRLYPACVQALLPGGALVLESYTPRQLERPGVGGPSSVDMLMTPDDVRKELAGLRFERCAEIDRDVAEGVYHDGPSTTVQVLAFKP